MLLRERVPGGRCLAGSGRWQTPSDPWQLFGRTNRRQHDRVGIAESVAPTRADSSAKYRRTLADRFRQQQRNFFEQATHSSTDSTERRRSITIGDEVFKFRQPLTISDEYKTVVTQRTLREIENIPCWLLVADIRGFTPHSRSMQSEDLDVLLGAWIFTCKEIIENHHGIINK